MKTKQPMIEDQVIIVRNPILRWMLFILGFVFVGLAILGIIIPILPATPNVLIAAACFAKSSPRFYFWMVNNKTIGPLLIAWRNERRIPLKAKILATVMIILMLGFSIVYVIPLMWVKILLAITGVVVLAMIWRYPH